MKTRICRECEGTGYEEYMEGVLTIFCKRCNGSGKIEDTYEHVSKPVSRVLENLERPSSQLGSREK